MNEEERAAMKRVRELQKKTALHMLWGRGWTEEAIAAALSVPVKRVRQWRGEQVR